MKYLTITKTLTFEPEELGLPFGKYVFQRVAPGRGNVPGRPRADLQLRRHVIPADPETPAQIARRDLFRAAVERWHARTPSDLDHWKQTAHKKRIPLFNACLSDTLKHYHLENGVLVHN